LLSRIPAFRLSRLRMTRLDMFDYPLPEAAIAQRMIRRPFPPIYSGRGRFPLMIGKKSDSHIPPSAPQVTVTFFPGIPPSPHAETIPA